MWRALCICIVRRWKQPRLQGVYTLTVTFLITGLMTYCYHKSGEIRDTRDSERGQWKTWEGWQVCCQHASVCFFFVFKANTLKKQQWDLLVFLCPQSVSQAVYRKMFCTVIGRCCNSSLRGRMQKTEGCKHHRKYYQVKKNTHRTKAITNLSFLFTVSVLLHIILEHWWKMKQLST